MLSALDLTDDEHAPAFVSNIITVVLLGGELRFFVSESYCWHLKDNGIDERNIADYLATLSENETNAIELEQYFTEIAELFDAFPEEAEDHAWDIYPSLYIDVDKRFLCVLFDEYIFSHAFCDSAPKDWHCCIHARLELIPPSARYWVVDGTDMIVEHVFDWTKQSCIWDNQRRR